jgi:hypothetical protein
MLTSQICDELLIRIRFRSAQFVIEMHHRENNPQFVPQLQQKSQKSNRIDPPGDGHANAIPGAQQFMPSNVGKHALRQGIHRNMVQRSTPENGLEISAQTLSSMLLGFWAYTGYLFNPLADRVRRVRPKVTTLYFYDVPL